MFTRICASCMALAIVFAGVLFLSPTAQAKGIRFVASHGDDANTCQRKRPCRTLQRGIDSAPDGGAVVVVDPAKYGATVTIDKSITIDATVGGAVIDGIVINAAGGSVVLRGLLLNGTGLPGGTDGLVITAAASVHIIGCKIEHFDLGILVDGDNSDVSIVNTLVRSNTEGLFLNAASTGNLVAVGTSSFEQNTNSNILVQGSNEVSIERSVAAGGNVGLAVDAGTARISDSVFVNNVTGLDNTGGTLLSRQNNTVDGNGTNTSGAITPLPAI